MQQHSIVTRSFVPAILGMALALCAATAAADSFVVNTDGSTADAHPGDGTCADVGGHCTLQAAILEGNSRAGAHTITFTIPTVLLQADLPVMQAPFTINGGSGAVRTVISGNGNTYNCFDLTDSGDMTAGHAWDTNTGVGGADGSVLNNLVIKNCKGDGISANGHGYTFKDNYIGTDITGTMAAQNGGHGITISASHVYTQENQSFFNNISGAVTLLPQPTSATVSAFASSYTSLATASFLGPVEITGNVISGNALNGIDLFSENLGFVLISNNFLGTDLTGAVAIPNGQYGVSLTGSTWGHLIGPNNVISGNLLDGVFIFAGPVTLPNYVMGNRIGVSLADQSADIGNVGNGVNVNGTSVETTMGRANPTTTSLVIGPGNMISDNKMAPSSMDPDVLASDGAGVVVTGGTTNGVIVRGNTIGLAEFAATPQPTKAYGNAGDGIAISASGVQIGGTGPGDANVIAANARHGIVIKGSSNANTLIEGNSIGVHPAIVGNLSLGNGADGIHINAAILSTIGGSGMGAGNTIAANGRNGVRIRNGDSSSGWANLLQRNSIYGNSRNVLTPGVGIDLDRVDNATNPLDVEHIGNSYSNFDQASPAICTGSGDPAECAGFTASHSGASSTGLDWTIHTHGPASMRIEFFKLDTSDVNTATTMSFIGEQVVTTDASGFPTGSGCTSGRCTASVAGASAGGYVVATASDITAVNSVAYPSWMTVPGVVCLQSATTCTIDNTSEFSNIAQPTIDTTTVVSIVNPAGSGNSSGTATSVSGQSVDVTVTVTAGGGANAPTGSVTVNAGGSSCSATLGNPSGTHSTGTCTLIPNLAVNASAYAVTASYAGAGMFNASTSSGAGNGSLTVNKASTTTAINAHVPDPSIVGTPIAVTATVTVTSPGSGAPSGTITVSDGTSTCTITLPGGTSCNLVPATSGAKTLTATYAGDSSFSGSASSGVAHQVNNVSGVATTTAISVVNPQGSGNVTNAATSVYGQPVSVTVTVTALSGAAAPGGTVTVTAGASACPVTLALQAGLVASGSCTLTPAVPAAVGAYSVSGAYLGNASFAPSSSSGGGNGSLTVGKASTTAAISAHTPNPSNVNAAIAVTAGVSVTAPGSGTPTGTIMISDSVATCTITLPATSCNLTPTTSGTKTLTAAYSGDANFSSITSPGVSHTVNAGGATATTTAVTQVTPSSAMFGQSVGVTVSVTALSGAVGPAGTVNVGAGGSACIATLGAPVGLTATGSCSLAPALGAAAAPYTVSATYAGNATFSASSSTGGGNGSVTVGKAATATAITGHTPNPSNVNAPILVTATVTVVAPGAGTPTGTITISDGTVSCVITLPTPACNLTPTTAGAKTLTATYVGDANFAGGAAPTAGHTVNPGGSTATTTAVTLVSPAAAVYGQTVAVTASVMANSGIVGPTGTLTMSAGGSSCVVILGPPSGTSNTGACNLVPPLPASAIAYPVTAAYSGSASLAASTSSGAGNGTLNVNKAPTATTITGHVPSPSAAGLPIAVTAGVTVSIPGAGTPTGMITVSDGTVNCVITLPATTCNLTPNIAGQKTLTATYSGDGNFAVSAAPGVLHTVTAGSTVTSTAVALVTPSTMVFGQPVAVTASVTAATGAVAPDGNVIISAGPSTCTATLGSPVALTSTGTCALTPGPLVAGSPYTVTSSYPGTATFANSTSSGAGNKSLTVNAAVTTTTISGHTPNPSSVNAAILVTAGVAVTAPGAGTPTGSIAVTDGTVICTITLPATTCNLTPTTTGAKTLTAVYSGDANFNGSVSPGVGHTVNVIATSTAVTLVSPATAVFGQPVSVTASVTAASGANAPAGSVTITAGASSCTAALGSPVVLTATATCALAPPPAPAASAYSITASYPGTASFGASASGGAGNGSLTVNKATTMASIVNHTPNPSIVNTPIAITAAVAVSAPGAGTPSGSITISDGTASCVITLPANSCNLTPTLAGAKTLTATYSGDASFAGSVSGGDAHTVNPLLSFTGPTALGGAHGTVTLSGGGPACTLVSPVFIPVSPLVSPMGVVFPVGLFDFSTSGCVVGSTITIQIAYDVSLPPGTQYWKYGPTPSDSSLHWYVMPGSSVNGSTVTFSITDGQTGDDDLAANGNIVDQGGPGAPPFLVPVMGDWMRGLLVMLLLVLGGTAVGARARRNG